MDAPPISAILEGEMSDTAKKVLFVTGLSGAGLSTALKSLEDMGYEAIDNLPLSMVETLAQTSQKPLALGADCRTRGFSASEVFGLIDRLRQNSGIDPRLLFLDCDDRVLQQRFTETRRRHPLAVDRPISDGIHRERQMLESLREAADVAIDTSELSVHDFRRMLAGHFSLGAGPGLLIFITSFAFRLGIPREADMLFDVRFLDNPHWDPKLRPLTGQDAAVGEKIASDADYGAFFENMTRLLSPLLPRYRQEGKTYLTIAVGCTGGKHRSVFVAEQLFSWLDRQHWSVALNHRDLKTVANINHRQPQEVSA